MGSLEAGMQLVYERASCNITLHRDLSGPSQRAIVFPPPHPSSLSLLPYTNLSVSACCPLRLGTARGGCWLSLTLFISLFISYFSIYFPIYFSVLKRCKPDTQRRRRLRGFFLLSPTAFLLSSLSFLPPSKRWSLGPGSPLAAPSGEDKHSWRG